MWFPEVGYEVISGDHRLRLHAYDGSVGIVTFKTAAAARLALRPGRAELDCVAMINGFLPLGARLVSWEVRESGASAATGGATAIAAPAQEIDHVQDLVARKARRADSDRYDEIAGCMALAAIGAAGPSASPSAASGHMADRQGTRYQSS